MAIINQHNAFKKKTGLTKVPVNNSSWLMHFQYDADAQQLVVVLKSGGQYIYNEVDQAMFDQFVQAPSKGKFYSQYIKGKFTSTRLIDKTVGPEEGSHGNARVNITTDRKDAGTGRPGKSARSRYGY